MITKDPRNAHFSLDPAAMKHIPGDEPAFLGLLHLNLVHGHLPFERLEERPQLPPDPNRLAEGSVVVVLNSHVNFYNKLSGNLMAIFKISVHNTLIL